MTDQSESEHLANRLEQSLFALKDAVYRLDNAQPRSHERAQASKAFLVAWDAHLAAIRGAFPNY